MRRNSIMFVLAAAFAMNVACGSPRQAAPQTATASVSPPWADPPIDCDSCDEWNAPREAFKVFGNTYFVGTQGLSSVLLTSPAGLVLIDAALPQSVPVIDANVRKLGFRTSDIKYILTSHAHFDHVGGVRSMQRLTRASVAASASTALALALGHPVSEDPQFGTGPLDAFPAITEGVRVMSDGETLQFGGTTITAHYTPGHTPGATTWTWKSCEGDRCLNVVYVDSLSAISNEGFRYTDSPGLVDGFRASLRKVAALPCDVLLSTHPSATGMDEKVAKRSASKLEPGAAGDPFVDAGACKALAALSTKKLNARVAAEAR